MKIKTQRTMQKHILNWYNKATSEELEAGKDWYNQAHIYARELAKMFEVNIYQVAQVISILSPQVNWHQNKENALRLIECWYNGGDLKGDVLSLKMFANELQKVTAIKALQGVYKIPAQARKTKSFSINIFAPDCNNFITIDRHATKVAINDLKGGDVLLTKKNYSEIEQAYKKVADRLDLIPCQLQAITWLTYKRVVNR